MSYYLDHEKLEVYQFAIRFVLLADEIVQDLPRGRAYLADQLRRAGASIALNIAEGAFTLAQTRFLKHDGYSYPGEQLL